MTAVRLVPTESLGLGALSRADSCKLIDAEPTTWVVEGIIRSTDYGAFIGPKGAGKSWALDDLGVSVALGESWLGRFPTTRARVLVLTCEESLGQTWKRLDAITRSKGRDPTEVENQLFVHPVPFSVIRNLDQLRVELARFSEVGDSLAIGLVVLDPAYKYLGGANMRDLFAMGDVLTALQVGLSGTGRGAGPGPPLQERGRGTGGAVGRCRHPRVGALSRGHREEGEQE
jgi:hypothetical protein